MSDFKAFVSSVFDELHNERDAICEGLRSLRRLGIHVQTYAYEHDHHVAPVPKHISWQEELHNSDLYFGIFWRKYGIETVAEFRQARDAGIPCFIYVKEFHAAPHRSDEREPEMVAFLDEINGDSGVTIGKFMYARDLKSRVGRDVLQWLYRDGIRATTELTRTQQLLASSVAQAKDLESKIATLEAKLRSPRSTTRPSSTSSPHGRLHRLQSRLLVLRRENSALRKRIDELHHTVRAREAQTERATSALEEGTSTTDAPPEFANKEDLAAAIQRILETHLGVQVVVQHTSMHVDLTVTAKRTDGSREAFLLRVVDAPIKFSNITTFESILAESLEPHATSGLLFAFSPHLSLPLVEIFRSDLGSAYLIGPSAHEAEEQIHEIIQKSIGLIDPRQHILVGDRFYARGDLVGAIDWYQSAAHLAAESAQPDIELLAWVRLARTWRWIPNAYQAIACASIPIARARHVELPNLVTEPLYAEAVLYLIQAVGLSDLRRYWSKEIQPLLQEGIEKLTLFEDNALLAEYLLCKGEYEIVLGDLVTARKDLDHARNAADIGAQFDAALQCRIYLGFSTLARTENNNSEAVWNAETALRIASESGLLFLVARARLTLSSALSRSGKALRLVRNVRLASQKYGWKGIEQQAQHLYAELAFSSGNTYAAFAAGARSSELAQELRFHEAEVVSLLSISRALIAAGRIDQARESLNKACRLSQERDYADYFFAAEQLLAALPSLEQ